MPGRRARTSAAMPRAHAVRAMKTARRRSPARAAAEVYGLNLLVAEIEDRPDNTTRFLVIGRKAVEPRRGRQDHAARLGRENGCAGRAVPPARAARAAQHQPDAHRIAPVAQEEMGLRVLHRRRGPRRAANRWQRRSPSSKRARRCTASSAPIPKSILPEHHVLRSSTRRHASPASSPSRATSRSRIAPSCSARSRTGDARFGFPRRRRLPLHHEGRRALGVRVERPGPGEVIVDGVGLRGLRAPTATLDMGNAGTAMRLFMGLLSAQPFDSELDRRRVADAPADGARREAAAFHGCPHRNARRQTAGANSRRTATAGHPLRDAGRQRAGEIRGAARGAVRARRDHRGRTSESRAITPSACCRASVARSVHATAWWPSPRRGRCMRQHIACRATSRPPRSSWSRRASERASLHDPRRRREPDAYRHPGDAGPDGRRPAPGQSPQLRHGAGGRHRSAAVAAQGRVHSRATGAARDRRVSRAVRRCGVCRRRDRSSPAPRSCA